MNSPARRYPRIDVALPTVDAPKTETQLPSPAPCAIDIRPSIVVSFFTDNWPPKTPQVFAEKYFPKFSGSATDIVDPTAHELFTDISEPTTACLETEHDDPIPTIPAKEVSDVTTTAPQLDIVDPT